jgi:hypothetical protein
MTSGGTSARWAWLLTLSLAGCADHTEEDLKACAGYACTAGTCQAGPSGPVCVCGAIEQSQHLTCELVAVDVGTDDTQEGATTIAVDSAVSGDIGAPNFNHFQDYDYYRFQGTAGRVYLVEGTAEMEVVVDLFDSGGILQTEDRGTAFRLAAPSSGAEQFVGVRALDPKVLGRYAFRVTDLGPADDDLITLGPAPAVLDATLAPDGDQDSFGLVLDIGHVYQLGCAFDAPLQATFQVNGASSPSGGAPVTFKALQDSLPYYRLLVSGAGVGNYRCTLDDIGGDDVGDTVAEAKPLGEAPAVWDGQAEFPGDRDVFAIGAHAGKYLWAHVPGCFAGFVAPDGTPLQNQAGGHGWANPGLLPTELTYAVVTCPQIGSYELSFVEYVDAEGNDEASATPVVPGPIEGRLDGWGDVDVFRFDGVAHHVYTVPFHGGAACGLAPSNVGRWTIAIEDYYRLVFVADQDQTVFLVRAWNQDSCTLDGPADYSEMLEDTGLIDSVAGTPELATPATLGAGITGSLQFVGDVDCFAYNLAASTGYLATLSYSDTVSSASMTLYAPDDSQIPVGVSPAVFTTSAAGRYALCVTSSPFSLGYVPPLAEAPYTLVVSPQ